MRALSTLLYAVAAAFALVVGAAAVIGTPQPGETRHGGLTAATVLSSDGSRADAAPAAPVTDSPSS